MFLNNFSQLAIWKFKMAPIFFKMATILHVKSVLITQFKSVGWLEWSWCPFECLMAAGIISNGFVTIWKSKMAPTFIKDGHHYQGSKNWGARGLSKSTSGTSIFTRLQPVGSVQNNICVCLDKRETHLLSDSDCILYILTSPWFSLYLVKWGVKSTCHFVIMFPRSLCPIPGVESPFVLSPVCCRVRPGWRPRS